MLTLILDNPNFKVENTNCKIDSKNLASNFFANWLLQRSQIEKVYTFLLRFMILIFWQYPCKSSCGVRVKYLDFLLKLRQITLIVYSKPIKQMFKTIFSYVKDPSTIQQLEYKPFYYYAQILMIRHEAQILSPTFRKPYESLRWICLIKFHFLY